MEYFKFRFKGGICTLNIEYIGEWCFAKVIHPFETIDFRVDYDGRKPSVYEVIEAIKPTLHIYFELMTRFTTYQKSALEKSSRYRQDVNSFNFKSSSYDIAELVAKDFFRTHFAVMPADNHIGNLFLSLISSPNVQEFRNCYRTRTQPFDMVRIQDNAKDFFELKESAFDWCFN